MDRDLNEKQSTNGKDDFMHNNNEFNKKLKDFIGSDKRMVLVKGYVNNYRINNSFKSF